MPHDLGACDAGIRNRQHWQQRAEGKDVSEFHFLLQKSKYKMFEIGERLVLNRHRLAAVHRFSWQSASRSRSLDIFRRYRIAIVVAEMRAHIIHDRSDLIVAHHPAE